MGYEMIHNDNRINVRSITKETILGITVTYNTAIANIVKEMKRTPSYKIVT